MYYVQIPEPAIQKNLVTGDVLEKALTFHAFVYGTLLFDSRFTANWKAIRAGENIVKAIESAKPGQWVELQDSDYDLLKEVADQPKGLRPDREVGYPSGVYIQAAPLIRAIMSATADKPQAAAIASAVAAESTTK